MRRVSVPQPSGLCLILFLAALFALTSCSSSPPPQVSTGAAYAGPATLNLRKDLGSKAATVGTANHGEKLEILETRRRFVKVRTPGGIEGWTDSNLLLSALQMEDLQKLAESAKNLPSQGAATVFEALNMHTEPNRQSPGFFQIPEGGAVEVIGHRVSPRVQPSPVSRVAAPARRVPAKKGKAKDAKAPPPYLLPPPAPPALPQRWQELSRPRANELGGRGATVPDAQQVPMDDWNLVRLKDGKVGWVLARMVNMSVPDEVAQYAEGHRITAYVPLGDVKDDNQIKHNWLWTTAGSNRDAIEFDSFRVFVWSTRRHRYETAYIERNVRGYYPVETRNLSGNDEKAFSLVLEGKDGKLYKQTYAFSGYHVRKIATEPFQPGPELPRVRPSTGTDLSTPAPSSSDAGGWRETLTNWRRRIWK